MTEKHIQTASDLPEGLAKPAQRALANAGCSRLKDLVKLSEDEVRKLHGMGPKALNQIRQALRANGLSFRPPKKSKR
jgi:DNA-directed RNA polymerase alpha subunit